MNETLTKQLLLMLLIVVMSSTCSAQGCLKLDIVMLVDVSSSVDGNEKYITDAINCFNKRFEDSQVNTSLIFFSNGADIQYHLGKPSTFKVYCMGTTNLHAGLASSLAEFTECGRIGYNKIIILISDGDVDKKDDCKRSINLLKSIGIRFMGIQIKSPHEFMKEVCDVYTESDYESLAEELRKMDVCL